MTRDPQPACPGGSAAASPGQPFRFCTSGAILDRLTKVPGGPLTGAVLSFGFVILKVLFVARGDLTTTLGIVKSAGSVQILVGTVVSGLPMLTAAFVLFAFYRFGASPSDEHWTWLPAYLRRGRGNWRTDAPYLFLFAILVSGWFAPGILFASGIIVGALLGPMRRRINRRRSRDRGPEPQQVTTPWTSVLAHTGMVIAATPMVAVGLFQMWLPYEAVHFTSGDPRTTHVAVGSVIDDGGTWDTVLLTGSRALARIEDDAVFQRAICTEHGSLWLQTSILTKVRDVVGGWVGRHWGLAPVVLPRCPSKSISIYYPPSFPAVTSPRSP